VIDRQILCGDAGMVRVPFTPIEESPYQILCPENWSILLRNFRLPMQQRIHGLHGR
jgi:hypothetical protein